ncbi:hypothetical protein ACFU7D_11540 [Nocardioides sp. NPDC057577]|uniref:hypothetical protein n=1 Tax=Nocardioides sp. NPDC057577 TaxID=3346171 RepID=UPI00366C7F72
MTEPQRVRVTGPPRRRPAVRRVDVDEDTRLGEVYLGSLMRAQLSIAVRTLVVLLLGVGSLPLLFWLAPGLVRTAPFGVPLPWLLLGVLVYPFLFLLGRWYLRGAERNEASYADLLRSDDEAP